MRHLTMATLSTLIAVTALGACSDDSGKGLQEVLNGGATTVAGNGGSLPGDGICNLATTDEISAAVGKPFADGVESDQSGIPVCTWTSTLAPSDASLDPIEVTIAILPFTATDQQTFDTLVADKVHTKVLDGLGDIAIAQCAFSSTDDCPWFGKVFVVKGDQYLEVDLSNFSTDDFTDDQILAALTGVATVVAPQF